MNNLKIAYLSKYCMIHLSIINLCAYFSLPIFLNISKMHSIRISLRLPSVDHLEIQYN